MIKKRFLSILALLCLTVSGAWAGVQWAGGTYTATANENRGAITVNDDATLTINEGVTVTVTGGINVAEGKTLTVTGPGTLVVNGANGADGADSESDGGPGGDGGVAISGNIIVQGGATVTATGGTGGNGGSAGWTGVYGGNGGNGGNAFAGTLTYKSGTVTANGGSGGTGGSGSPVNGSSGSAGKAFANDVDFTQTTGYSVTDGTSTIGSVLDQIKVVISGGTATVAVTGVTLAPTSATLIVGETTTLTPTVAPGDATDKSVTWSSSNTSVATVSNSGVVTAVGAGTAIITVTTTDGAFTATCTVTVAEPTYTVSLKEGTDDAAKWQGKAGTGEYQALPLEGVAAGTALTVKYDGRKRVRSVKAVKKAADPLTVPLTMEALTDGTIVVNIMGIGGARRYDFPDDFSDDYSESRKRAPGRRGISNISWKYSVNGGDKTTINEETTTIDVNAGDKVQLYGNGPDLSNYSVPNISGGTAQVKVYGNIMSMLDEDNYATLTTLPFIAFYVLFGGNENLTDASGLLLPATTLAEHCYYGMFYGCTSLTTAPALPATTLTEACYGAMFSGCTSLTTAPTLPATTLANSCYNSMFSGCTSLTTAPALPATTLAGECYSEMFSGCTSLSSITCLATEGINENGSTSDWVNGVASTGTFTKASGATWPEGVNGIPSGWTVNEQ